MSAGKGRRGSLGCLGVLSIVLLLGVTAGELMVLRWLDPAWLDRVAFWRPAPLEPEPLPVEGEVERQAFQEEYGRRLGLLSESRQIEAAEPELFPFLEVRQSYDPSRGARLETPWDTLIEVPPGAIDSPCDLTLTPVRGLPGHMAVEAAGPAVDLRIGEAEHYDFRRPVRITLPFDPAAGGDPRLAVWEGDGWTALPTVVDRGAGTVTAEVEHASLFVVAKLLAAAGGGFYAVYQMLPASWLSPLTIAKALARAAVYAGSETLETQYFRIHYYTSGPHAVPADADYPVRSGQPAGGAPLYVKDLAAWFEECRLGFQDIGLPIRPWTVRRHDVFVSAQKDYGSSPLGGPLFISSRNVSHARKGGIDPEALLRHTVAHELFHTAQEQFYSMGGARTHRWWIECSAAYLGDTYWKLAGGESPNIVRDAYCRDLEAELMDRPLDSVKGTDSYGWAALFLWLDRQYGAAGFKVFADLTADGTGSLEALDAALRKHTQKSLAEIFAEFAGEYHYGDLWRAEITPTIHRGKSIASAALKHTPSVGRVTEFTNVIQRLADRTVETAYDDLLVKNLVHLTAHAFYLRADHLPERRRAKLVVKLTLLGGFDPGLWISTAEDRVGASLPIAGQPSGLKDQILDSYRKTWVFDGFSTEGGTDLVTLVIANCDTSGVSPGYEVERWLLEPPQNVDFRPKSAAEPDTWVITWDDVGLSPERVFAGFHVYRRTWGEPDEAAVRVTEWPLRTEREREDTPERPGSHVYTVTVVDVEGNESRHSRIQLDDPFEGRWEGRIALAEGSLSDILGPLIDHYLGGEGSAQLQSLRTRLQGLATGADAVARMGVPVELDINRYASGRYVMRVQSVFGREITDAEPVPLEKKGEQTLVVGRQGLPDQPPLVLRLTAVDEMKDRDFSFPVVVNGAPRELTLRWTLRRALPDGG